MKRLLAAALLIACAVGLTSRADAGAPAVPKWQWKQLSWEQYGPSTANGSCNTCGIGTKTDTTFIGHVAQTTAIVDTTEAFSLANFAFNVPDGGNSATAHGAMRVYLYQTASTALSQSFDSLYVALDTGLSTGGPWIPGSFVGGLAMTAGDPAGSIMLLVDSDDNSAVSTASKLYGAPAFRLRIRSDGNSAAIFGGAKVMIGYPTWQDD